MYNVYDNNNHVKNTVKVACEKSPGGFFLQDYDKLKESDVIYKDKILCKNLIRKQKARNKITTTKI